MLQTQNPQKKHNNTRSALVRCAWFDSTRSRLVTLQGPDVQLYVRIPRRHKPAQWLMSCASASPCLDATGGMDLLFTPVWD